MGRIIFTFTAALFLLISSNCLIAQKSYGNIYKPEANAVEDIKTAIDQAKASNKHVFLQVGVNWCVWCYRFQDFVDGDETLTTIVEENYVVYHLNYSAENFNKEVLATYGFPQRFGFPVFVVLDGEGKRLHTQNSALLESGQGYDMRKVKEFFMQWTPAALDPNQY